VFLYIKNLLFTIFIPGTVAVYLPLFIVRGSSPTNTAVLFFAGLILLAVGAAAYFWTVWDFARFGRGTPLPIDAPRKLVVRGLYRYTRNPMYLAVLTIIIGWAWLYSDAHLLLYAVGVATAVHLFVIFYEEPALEKLFGGEYLAYRASVPRWLPRIYHRL
jgi:protein-S-isoprenylcysteine O-methyltransferase Ste14